MTRRRQDKPAGRADVDRAMGMLAALAGPGVNARVQLHCKGPVQFDRIADVLDVGELQSMDVRHYEPIMYGSVDIAGVDVAVFGPGIGPQPAPVSA